VRIISGRRRGKRIIATNNLPVRPTTDFAKEALFSILNNYFDFEEITVLDLFSGTGNISYEFASRGAPDILAVDNFQPCVRFIQHTSSLLEFHSIKVFRADAIHFLDKFSLQRDIIFADPPYDYTRIYELPAMIFDHHLLTSDGMLIIEHSVGISFGEHPCLFDTRRYGSVCFSFFRNQDINETDVGSVQQI
jgi:16S rRNA (guanine(966)-N(2))-methyltransferase RsmD